MYIINLLIIQIIITSIWLDQKKKVKYCTIIYVILSLYNLYLLVNKKEYFTHGNQLIIPNNLMSFYTSKRYPSTETISVSKTTIPEPVVDFSDPPYYSEYKEEESVISKKISSRNSDLDLNMMTSTELNEINNRLDKISNKLSLLI
jgi:hypothetical protein